MLYSMKYNIYWHNTLTSSVQSPGIRRTQDIMAPRSRNSPYIRRELVELLQLGREAQQQLHAAPVTHQANCKNMTHHSHGTLQGTNHTAYYRERIIDTALRPQPRVIPICANIINK